MEFVEKEANAENLRYNGVLLLAGNVRCYPVPCCVFSSADRIPARKFMICVTFCGGAVI